MYPAICYMITTNGLLTKCTKPGSEMTVQEVALLVDN